MKEQWREVCPERKEGNPCNPVLEGAKVIDCREGDEKGRYKRGGGAIQEWRKSVCAFVWVCVCERVCASALVLVIVRVQSVCVEK